MADAKVTVGADVEAVKEAANVALKALKGMAADVKSAFSDAASGVVSDLGNIVAAAGKVNFSAQHEQVKAFEAGSARMAVSMGRDLESVRAALEQTGTVINKRPRDVLAWADSVGRLTYNFEGAVKAQEGLSGLAAQTGRSVDDYRGLATELANVAKVGGDTSDVIGVLAGQAEKLGVKGGVAAFADQIEALGDTISRFSVKSTADFERVTAVAAALGKGLTPQAAGRAQQGVLGAIQADPMRWERYLGRTLLDEHGQVDAKQIPSIIQDIVSKTDKRFGSRSKRVLEMNFGNEAGAAMWNAAHSGDLSKGAMASAVNLFSGKPAAALAASKATDAGQRDKAAVELDKASRNLMGSSTLLGQAADALLKFSGNHPIAGAVAAGVAGGIVSAGAKAAGGLVGAGGRMAVAGLGGGAAAAATAAGLVGVGVAGYYGIKKFEQAGHERLDAIEAAGASEQQHKNRVRRGAAAERAAYMEQTLGMSHGAAVFASQHENDRSSPVQRAQAIDATFQAQLAKAIQDGLSKAKIDVKTRQDTPVEVSVAGGGQAHAGGQHGG